jgi:rod shape-determining protein MreB
MEAGSAEVHTVPSTLAAALGSGADVGGPYAEMVVDLGAGLTEMAVFRNGAAVACAAAEVGTEDGPSMLDRIVDAVRAFWRGLCEDDQVETIESGLVVSGGGALMAPLVARLQEALGLTLRIGPQPEQAVVRGLFRVARSL